MRQISDKSKCCSRWFFCTKRSRECSAKVQSEKYKLSLDHTNSLRTILRRLIWAALVTVLFVSNAVFAAIADNDLNLVIPQNRILNPIDENDLKTLTGNQHPSATKENDVGSAEDTIRFERMMLSLKPDATQNAALEKFLATVHDRSSQQYGQWLTGKKFEEHFGVAQQDITLITDWLTIHGFTIDEIPTGHRTIIFSGTVAQIRSAFHTEIHNYIINGEHHLANATDPQIPAALAAVVGGVVSLHDIHSQPLHTRMQVAPDYTTGSTHYLAAADFQTIYNLKPLYSNGINGSGRSIAILGRSNVVFSDIQQFRTTMNLPANAPQIIVNGTDPGLVSGDQGESDLDLEWSGAVAPAATIKFVTSASTGSTDGIALSAQYAVSNNVAEIISLSYGQCESSMGTTALNYFGGLWQQAAALGITVMVSAGDSGAAGCDSASATRARGGRAVNGLCTSLYSICVGGTQFADTSNPSLYWSSGNSSADLGSALSYIPEVVWNESGSNGGTGLWATGGGASTYYAKPSWQTTPGVPADGKRDVPDVSLTAAGHDGYLVYSSDNTTQTQTLYAFGGTSASAPSFAGIMALVNQKTGYRQGNANVTLYGLASRQAGSGTPAYFHQITSGNNSVPGVTGFSASTASPNYNQATGLGSVDGNVLVNHWTDLLPVSSTALTASPNPGSSGQNITFTATVNGTFPTGTVQFADGPSSLGSPVALSGGAATLVSGALAAGSHSITARYSGDASNQPSTSAAWLQTILNTTMTTLSAAPASITVEQVVSFTATVNGAAPTGTVQFMDGAATLGVPATLNSATASIITNALTTAGNHNITAVYSGDANNAPSISQALIENVVQATSSVTMSTSASLINAGTSVTITATVSGAAPTGSVQFTDGGTNLGTAISISGGMAMLTTASLAVGSHGIVAIYSGDANNLGSTSPVLTLTVSANSQTGMSETDDAPTLPQWAELLMGVMLVLVMFRKGSRYG